MAVGDSVIVDLKAQGVKDLADSLGLVSKGMTELDKSLVEANKELAKLDKNSQAFKDLTKEINAATIASNAYSENTDTLKRELRSTTDEIGKLERALKALDKAGEKNSQTYKDLATKQDELKKKAGQLKDTVQDLNAEIKNSGSDTKNLDKALRAIGAVAAGYQIAQGAMVLFGTENKKFEQALLKLNAVMAITNGLQQIQNELSKKDSIFTAIATKAKEAYSVAVGKSTGAMKLLNQAFFFTGIGALIIAVITLISNFDKLTESGGFLGKALGAVSDVVSKAIQGYKDLSDAIGLTDFAAKEAADREKDRQEQALLDLERFNKRKLGLMKIQHQDTLKEELRQAEERFKLDEKLFREAEDLSDDEVKKRIKSLKDQEDEIFLLKAQITQKGIDDEKKATEKSEKERLAELKKRQTEEAKILQEHLKRLQELRLKSIEVQKAIELKQGQEADKRRLFEDEKAQLNLREQQARITGLRLESDKNDFVLRDKLAEQERDNFEKKRQQEELESLKQQQSDRLELAGQSANALFQIAQGISDFRKQILDKELESGIISEKKYAEELRKIKRQEAIANKAQAVFNIGISIAEAIVKALAAGPIVGQILAGITAGLGFAQLAFVLATPIPKFAKGVIDLQDSKQPNGVDTVPAMLSKGESVMTVNETKENKDALVAMRKGKFKELFIPKANLIQPDIFANIPNPANIEVPSFIDKDDYSSITSRLDKLTNEMYYIAYYTKQGNRDRKRGTEILSSKFNFRKTNPNL